MNQAEMESIPAIAKLNQFAERLPPEFRKELYETAYGFLSIGAMFGIFAGFAGAMHTGKKADGDDQKMYTEYLTLKISENMVPKKVADEKV